MMAGAVVDGDGAFVVVAGMDVVVVSAGATIVSPPPPNANSAIVTATKVNAAATATVTQAVTLCVDPLPERVSGAPQSLQ